MDMNMRINQGITIKGRKILIGVSGSIAAIKTPLLVSSLVKAGAEVRCIITPSASHLVSPLSLSTISRHRCYQDQDQWDPKESKPLHIQLSEWAEVIVVAPLSATSLARWIHGMGDGLLASVLLASECPVIAAAAMNTGMWGNQSVQNNWKELDKLPRIIKLDPSTGVLACDRIGEGKIVNEDIIRLAIESALIRQRKTPQINKDFEGLKLLVTAGATVEPLDPARYISNRSSGLMGISIAQAARFRGANVDLIYGNIQIPSSYLEGLNTFKIQDSLEMLAKLKEFVGSADFISMTAAISDLRRQEGSNESKLPKEALIESLTNELELVPDLLSQLSSQKKSQQVILGFAAVTGNDKELKVIGEAKRISKRCDFLMANPIDRKGQGFAENFNGGFLLGPNAMVQEIPVQSKFELANKLLDELLDFKSKIF
tara:strand:+ start:1130 stop:2419 length:1290 start_codon:yes stop_codon:yes gene_type:complete